MPGYRTMTLSNRTLGILVAMAMLALLAWTLSMRGVPTPWHRAGADPAPALRLDGQVAVTSENNVITKLVVPLAVEGNDGILLTEGNRLHATTMMSESASAAVPAKYSVAWVDGNGDEVLDPGEHAVLTVDLPSESSLHPGNPVDLVVHPVEGISLTVKVQ